VVGAFYLRARWEQHRSLFELPKKVSVDIQQTSEGFTLSKSEGGRTLFTIHASRATRFKEGGRATLHDVSITFYGRQSERADRIYGSDFEYDPKTGTVVSRGEVEIDLAGTGERPELGKEASQHLKVQPPPMPKEPIHVRLEQLSFNHKSGVAQSEGKAEFRLTHATGSARGLLYDSKKNELLLRSAIDIRGDGPHAERIQARSGTLRKEPRQLVLRGVEMSSEGHQLETEQLVVHLAHDNSMQRVEAEQPLKMSGGDGLEVRAARGVLTLGEGSRPQSGWLGGGVDFSSQLQATSGHAGEVRLQFSPGAAQAGKETGSKQPAQLQAIHARGGVELRQWPPEGSKNRRTLVMTSDAMTFSLRDGRELSTAQTEGPGELRVGASDAARGDEQTTIAARRFTADFGRRNHLRSVSGSGGVVVTARAQGEADKVSTSESLRAEFSPAGEISSAVQEGDVRYREGAGGEQGRRGRSVTAARASYAPRDESLTLTGSPRIVDGGMTMTADQVRLMRRGGAMLATGSVKTTYSELKAQPNGAMLASGEPVHVTAEAVSAEQSRGSARYSGGARLWQGANIVEAPVIEFDEQNRTIVARGDAVHPVRSVFVREDAKGKIASVLLTAPQLKYSDRERLASYTGGVQAKSEDGVLTAERADALLGAAGNAQGGAPGRLESIVASGGVLVRQRERSVRGEKLEYQARSGTFVMSGGSPTLTDPVNGTVRGNSLTFYSRDDRVVAEGGDASRAVTHTHISR